MKLKRTLGLLMSIALLLAVLPVFPVPAEAAGNVYINDTNFPDPVFRNYVSGLVGGRSVLTPSEIASIRSIDVHNKGVANMKGLEHFTALESLICGGSGNSFQYLYIAEDQNPLLQGLYCYDQPALIELDVNGHPALEDLNASGCTSLTELDCNHNALTFLDVSGCVSLETLTCSDNSLSTGLNLRGTASLARLICNFNRLTRLDVTQNSSLQLLDCSSNDLPSLDVSRNTQLKELDCASNRLNSLNLRQNTALTRLECGNNLLTGLDLSRNTRLVSLECGMNTLSALDLSGHSVLQALDCAGTGQLASLDLTGCTSLETLTCYFGRLTGLDLSDCTALKELDCINNGLEALDLSANTALERLDCRGNSIQALNVNNHTALAELYVNGLTELYCENCALEELDVTGCAILKILACSRNSLTTLDLSGNPALEKLYCSNNLLPSLDVTGNPALQLIYCDFNRLDSLDVTNNTQLRHLSCGANGIASLDISANPGLIDAYNGSETVSSGYRTWRSADGTKYLQTDADTVIVLRKPVITAQPSAKTIAENKYVTLSVAASGASGYRWQYSTDGGSTWKNCSSEAAYKADFRFKAAVSMDGRLYRCRVSNAVGSSYSGKAKLTVVGFAAQPEDRTAAAGGSAAFSVVATGSPFTYRWQYSKDGGSAWTDCTSPGSDQAAFSFTAKASMDGRLYRCVISRGTVQAKSAPAALTVTDPSAKPAIGTQPSNKTAASGKTAKFTVAATGSGLSYRWYYSKDNGATWTKCTSAGSDTASFSFSAKASMNGRLYRCKVTNSAGSVTSNSAKLTISDVKPAITGQPSAKSVTAGKTAKFTVAAAGSGLTYRWYYSKDNGATWTKCTSAGSDTASFSFTARASMNGRIYRCKVTNGYGSVTSSSAKLTVR